MMLLRRRVPARRRDADIATRLLRSASAGVGEELYASSIFVISDGGDEHKATADATMAFCRFPDAASFI